MGKKLTQAEVILEFQKIHGTKYDYSKVNYINSHEKIIIICKNGHEFLQKPMNHKTGRGCPKCAYPNLIIDSNDFLKRAVDLYGNKYDYSLSIFKNTANKIKIICKQHGVFEQCSRNYLDGQEGCAVCAEEKRRISSFKYDTNWFITLSSQKHYNKYDYSCSVFNGVDNNINIICPIHGILTTTPYRHAQLGRGCLKCSAKERGAKNKMTTDIFIEKSRKIHGDVYDYSSVDYIDSKTKVKIICFIHGEFLQKPGNHLNCSSGCPSCSHTSSKMEQDWLDSLGVPKEMRQQKIILNGKSRNIDAIDVERKICYEFYGDFWHGNPNRYDLNKKNNVVKKTFNQLYQNTLMKEILIKNAGYMLISIWETDWNKLCQMK